MLLAVVLAGAICGAAYLTQQASAPPVDPAPATVVVQAGDTLYSIAQRVAPDSDPREVVAQLRAANDIRPGEVGHLTPGDTLVIPRE